MRYLDASSVHSCRPNNLVAHAAFPIVAVIDHYFGQVAVAPHCVVVIVLLV